MVTGTTLVGSVSVAGVIGDEGGSVLTVVTVTTLVGSVSVTGVIGDEGGSLLAVVTVTTLVGSVSVTGVIGDEGGSLLAVVTVTTLGGEPVSTEGSLLLFGGAAVVAVLGVPGWFEGVYILSGLPVEAPVGVLVVGGGVGSGVTTTTTIMICALYKLIVYYKPNYNAQF